MLQDCPLLFPWQKRLTSNNGIGREDKVSRITETIQPFKWTQSQRYELLVCYVHTYHLRIQINERVF
uniref:Uncharacterized protein n=1 Tax=Lepeophtheirus salmonis TaxID=72036 RepID=A0A0K2TP78_LEPSM